MFPRGYAPVKDQLVDITINGKDVKMIDDRGDSILLGRILRDHAASIQWEDFNHQRVSARITASRIYFRTSGRNENTGRLTPGVFEYDLRKQ